MADPSKAKPPEGADIDDLLPPSAGPAAPASSTPPKFPPPPSPMTPRGGPMAPMPNPMAPAAGNGPAPPGGYQGGPAYPTPIQPQQPAPAPVYQAPAAPPSEIASALADVRDEAVARTSLAPRRRNNRGTLVLLGAGGLLAVVAGVVFMVLYNKEKDADLAQQNQNAVTPPAEEPKEGEPAEPPAETSKKNPKQTVAIRNNGDEAEDDEESADSEADEPESTAKVGKTKKGKKGKTRPIVTDPDGEMPDESMPDETMPDESMPEEAMDEPAEGEGDPAVTAKIKAAVAAARVALGQRKFPAARKQLEKAKGLVATADQEELVERMELVATYNEQFWEAVNKGIAGVEPAEELKVGSTPFILVDATPGMLQIRLQGKTRSFKLPDELPYGMAISFAERWYDASDPQNKVFIGAFALVDPAGGKDKAAELWLEAAGAGVNLENLMPLLEEPEVDESVAEAGKGAVPTGAALTAAEKAVRSQWSTQLTAAKTSTKKAAVVKEMLAAAEEAEDEATRYVTLRAARDVAVSADQPTLMIEAVDAIAASFQIDALEMKLESLTKAKPEMALAARAVARTALELLDEALAAKKYEQGKELAVAALAAARKAASPDLVKQLTEKNKEILAKMK